MVLLLFCLVTVNILALNVNQIEASDALQNFFAPDHMTSIWGDFTVIFKIVKLIMQIVSEFKLGSPKFLEHMKEILDLLKKYFPTSLLQSSVSNVAKEIKDEAKETIDMVENNLKKITNYIHNNTNGSLRTAYFAPLTETYYVEKNEELPNLDDPECRVLYSDLIKSVKNIYKELSENSDCTLPQSFLEKYYLGPVGTNRKIHQSFQNQPLASVLPNEVSFLDNKNNEYPYSGPTTPYHEPIFFPAPNNINEPLYDENLAYDDPTSFRNSPFTNDLGYNSPYNKSQSQFEDPLLVPVNSFALIGKNPLNNQEPIGLQGKSAFIANDPQLYPEGSIQLGQNMLLNNLPEQNYYTPANPYLEGKDPQLSIPNLLWKNPNNPDFATSYNHVQLNPQDFSNQLNNAKLMKQMHKANIKYMGIDYSPFAKQLNMQTVTNMAPVTDLNKLRQNIIQDNKKYSLLAFIFAGSKPVTYWPLYYTILQFPTVELLSRLDLLTSQGNQQSVDDLFKSLDKNQEEPNIASYDIAQHKKHMISTPYVNKYESNMPVLSYPVPENNMLYNNAYNALVPHQKTLKATTFQYKIPMPANTNKGSNIYEILKPSSPQYQQQSSFYGHPFGVRSTG